LRPFISLDRRNSRFANAFNDLWARRFILVRRFLEPPQPFFRSASLPFWKLIQEPTGCHARCLQDFEDRFRPFEPRLPIMRIPIALEVSDHCLEMSDEPRLEAGETVRLPQFGLSKVEGLGQNFVQWLGLFVASARSMHG
jgi:hypothetical protein